MSDSLSPRDAKVVMQLLKRALSRFDDADPPERVVALIPRNPQYGDYVKFSIATKEHIAVEVHSCAPATGNYGIPMDMRPEPTSQVTRLRFYSGGQKEIAAEDCLTWNDDFRVAVVARPDPEPFEIMATMQTGKAKRLKNLDRIRDAVKDANEQFENGLKYKDAPCLLMIFHDGLDVPDNTIIKSALYGNLKFVFPKGKPEVGELNSMTMVPSIPIDAGRRVPSCLFETAGRHSSFITTGRFANSPEVFSCAKRSPL